MPANKPRPSKRVKLLLSYSTCDIKPEFPEGKMRTRGGKKVSRGIPVFLLKSEVYELKKSRGSR